MIYRFIFDFILLGKNRRRENKNKRETEINLLDESPELLK